MAQNINDETGAVEINGIELNEGMSIWRYAALRTYNQTFGEQDPDDVLQETAEALVENYPDAVNGAPAHIVKANLKGTPGIYDHTDLMRYHAMDVTKVVKSYGLTVSIKDWKEGKTYAFEENREETFEGEYAVCEPLSVLEKHLGVTLLVVSNND